jgi:HlyD family secretion protein
MVNQPNNLFRKQALERSSSPERLDQIMQVVSPMKWLPLAALGTLVAAGVTWSIVGRIPITVDGKGVLVYPSKVVGFEFPTAGKLQSLNVHVGDLVQKGQVLGTIDQSDLQKQLQQQRGKLSDLESQNQNATSLQGQRSQLDLNAIAQQRAALEQRLQQTQSLTPIIRSKDIGALAQQRQNLQQRLQEATALAPTLKDRLERRKSLKAQGAISDDTVLEAEQTYADSIQKISDIKQQIKQLDISQVQAEKSYRDNLSQIDDVKAQLKQLDTKEKTLSEQNFQASATRQNQIDDLKRSIAQLEYQIGHNSVIKSDYTGRILEITATPGQILGQGTRIGTIDAQGPAAKLVEVAFLPVSQGKKIQKGMKVQITPTTVERERFGGILASVTNVSPFPVTKESAAKLVGNADLVGSLVSTEPQIQVLADLKPDPSTFSGYKWSSSKGPDMKMSPGTTTTVRITVKEEAPITFVLPILKSWSGIN